MRLRRLAAWAWTVGILVICWIPRGWIDRGSTVAGDIDFDRLNVDKAIHVVLFAMVVPLFARAGWPLWRAALLGLAVGFLSELGQTVPAIGRSFHWIDLLCDAAGVALGFELARRVSILGRPAPFPRPEEYSP